MKIAISNIAWDQSEDEQIRPLLREFQLSQVEIAPTKIWAHPIYAAAEQVRQYRDDWAVYGVQIISFQALLFGQPQHKIFADEETRKSLLTYLDGIMRLAEGLGAKVLVFGSPKNRAIGEMRLSDAWKIAVPFFYEVGTLAASHELTFCIEPNPPQYGCDFIRTANEALQLVRDVDHAGFRVHLDAGAMIMNDEPIETTLETCFDYLAHFHISEPNLAVVGSYPTVHQRLARTLSALGYQHSVSIEMVNKTSSSNEEAVRRALDFVTGIYGN